MPNGGPDNCGTCPHNRANERVPLLKKIFSLGQRPEPFCQLRDLALPRPFWIYCANHPAQNESQVGVPIGPVLIDATGPASGAPVERSDHEILLMDLAAALGGFATHPMGVAYHRRIWRHSPDTPRIRDELLRLVQEIPQTPAPAFPTVTKTEEMAIYQVGAFRDRRAIPALRRIAAFDPDASAGEQPYFHDRRYAVAFAIHALASLEGNDALDVICRGLERVGEIAMGAEANLDRYAPIRGVSILALDFCSLDQVEQHYRRLMVSDPAEPLRKIARERLEKRLPAP